MTPGKPFVVVKQPTDTHALGQGTGVLTKHDLERPSCGACYRPLLARAPYCDSCTRSGAALRHLKNQARA